MNAALTPHLDFNRLSQRLATHACLFLRLLVADAETGVVDGIGKSPSDFAADTILLLVDGQVTCTGDDNAVFACLRRVMEHDILDAKRSKSASTTAKVDTVPGSVDEDGSSVVGLDDYASSDDVHRTVEEALLKQRLYELLQKDCPDLFEVAFAVLDLNASTPREIAEVIGTTPSDVQNRKKRLRTFIAKNEIMKTARKATV